MMNQRSSNEKQTNMWYQIASSASNQRTKFVGFTLQTCDFAPPTRWRRELQKGVLYANIGKLQIMSFHSTIILNFISDLQFQN